MSQVELLINLIPDAELYNLYATLYRSEQEMNKQTLLQGPPPSPDNLLSTSVNLAERELERRKRELQAEVSMYMRKEFPGQPFNQRCPETETFIRTRQKDL